MPFLFRTRALNDNPRQRSNKLPWFCVSEDDRYYFPPMIWFFPVAAPISNSI